jgi:hypothetical protein
MFDNLLSRFRRSEAAFSGFKALGEGWWLASFTNAFKDRDGEILSQEAQTAYVRRVKRGYVPLPELWIHHTKGTRIGQATFVDRIGKSTFAIGKFDETPAGREAERYYRKHADETSLSHGFSFPMWGRDAGGVYTAFNTFEISVLPRGSESNPYTTFDVVKEQNKMPVSPDAEKYIREVLSKVADTVLTTLDDKEKQDKALETLGVGFKEFVDLPKDDEDDDEKAEAEAVEEETQPAADETVTEEVVAEETEAPAAEMPDEKAEEMDGLLTQVIEGQGVLMEMLTALSERIGAVETDTAGRYETMASQVKELQTILELGKIKQSVVKAAGSPADDKQLEAAVAAIETKAGPGDFDPLFPGLRIPRR